VVNVSPPPPPPPQALINAAMLDIKAVLLFIVRTSMAMEAQDCRERASRPYVSDLNQFPAAQQKAPPWRGFRCDGA
jgi:hypothetical protein